MRNCYHIRIELSNGEVSVLEFSSSTRTQMDKVFYALCFASPYSNMVSCSLYLDHDRSSHVDCQNLCEQINKFTVKTHV